MRLYHLSPSLSCPLFHPLSLASLLPWKKTQQNKTNHTTKAVLRCLYAYFLDLPSEEIPYLSIPLHTVIKLTPQAFGCNEKRFKLLDDDTHPSA